MHTVEAVARENGAVIQALPDDGIAVFPGDDAYTGMWRSLAASREALEFGFESGHHVYADHIHAESARTTCRLHTAQGSETLVLAAPGLHTLRNAFAATASAAAAGAPLEDYGRGSAAFHPARSETAVGGTG